MRKEFICLFLCIVGVFTNTLTYSQSVNWKKIRVLVYTKNGNGYVHDNIASAVTCIQKLGKQYGFGVDTASEAFVMTDDNLKQYRVLIFTSTNNDVFDTDMQRLSFRHYIEAGGGFVGIHSVTGTERNWKWFKMMLGGTFAWHPDFQKFRLRMINPGHPSMQGLPKIWEKADECYFAKELYPGPTVLMAHDLTSLNTSDTAQKNNIIKNAGTYADLYPAIWLYDFDGGHTWCTVLGHDKKDYADPVFVQHIFQGLRYVAGEVKSLDYGKAYAKAYNDPVEY